MNLRNGVGCFVVCGGLLVAGCSSESPDTPSPGGGGTPGGGTKGGGTAKATGTTEDFGQFTMLMPSGWEVGASSNLLALVGGPIVAARLLGPMSDEPRSTVVVNVYTPAPSDARAFAEERLEAMDETEPALVDAKVAGRSAVKRTYSTNSGSRRTTTYYLVENDQGYELVCDAPTAKFDSTVSTFDAIMQSVKFK